jgi:NitT/TauT family transport system permease protein
MTAELTDTIVAEVGPPPIDPSDSPVRAYRVKTRRRELAESVLPPLLLGAMVIGVWYLVSYFVLDDTRRFLLRPPHEVWQVGFADWENFSEILRALWSSTKVAFYGLTIAILIGFVLAMIMSQAKIIERAIFPFMVMLQAIPILAIVPLISFWFGTGRNSRVLVCILISLFPIVVNTLFGLHSADRGSHDLFTLHQASRWTRMRKLMLPAAMPAIFAGLRISAGLSVVGAIVGDFMFGKGEVGIGQRLKQYSNNAHGEELLAALILAAALGVAVFLLFGWIQKLAIGRWHESGSGS